jgi:predicted permease
VRRLLFAPLALLTDAALADSILGDLEELRHRQSSGSRRRAGVAFCFAAIGVILYALRVRLRESAANLLRSAGGTRGAGGDLQQAIRALHRKRGFACAAIALLALGIGANTAVFSIVRGVMLRPLPYERPEELVFIWGGTETAPDNRHSIMTGTHVNEIARQQTTFQSVAAFESWEIGLDGSIDFLRADGAERLRGIEVTPNFFELLGVRAALGRTFSSSDTEAAPVAIISHELWRRQFGGDPGAVGSEILIAGGRQSRSRPAFTIIGVLPDDFRFTYPKETEIYLLKPWTAIRPGRSLEYAMVGRLRSGRTAPEAQAELTAIAQNILRTYGLPAEYLKSALEREAMMAEPVADHLVAQVRPGLMVLGAVAALVLLIACVNIGLLMMSRTIDRTGELAVRAALGAGGGRILRLLLVEGFVLACIGGTAGLALASSALPFLRRLMPSVVPRMDEIAIDGGVLLFALAATILTALVCGLTPGLITVRRDLLAAVRRSGVTATADRGVAVLRMMIVGLQVAVVIVLLVGSGLLLHSFWRLQNVPLGFEAADVLTFETRLLNPKYREKGQIAAFEQQLLAAVRQIPGVSSASISTAVPMRGVDFIRVIGPNGRRAQWGFARNVDPDYFGIMEIPLLRGRLFTAADGAGSPAVIVVSESYGRAHFGREDPIGRRLEIGQGREAEIIGVVGDVRYSSVDRQPSRAFYLPRAQNPVELICLLVRPQPGMRVQVAAALRDVVRRIDPEQPIEGLTTIGELVSTSTADRRFYAVATGAFACVALLLAVAGVFGAVSRSVAERRREIAIRVALGADARTVIRLVTTYGLLPVLLGSLIGVIGAQAGSAGLESLLFEITPADPTTYAAAAGLILFVGLVACLIPAVRASRTPPMAALKSE